MRARANIKSQTGLSLVELLVTMALLSIAMGAVTGMLIMSMRSQQEINAKFRSQLDVRQAIYDMEKQIGESKRQDASANKPVFQADAVSLPTQNGNWVTYEYVTPAGSSTPTIVRINTAGKPATVPIAAAASSKKMINIGDSEQTTAVGRQYANAPVFMYYDDSGARIAAPVVNTRNVRSIKVSFLVTVSDGRDLESTITSTEINLRNF